MKTSLHLLLVITALVLNSSAKAEDERPPISLRMTAMAGDPEFRGPVLAAVRDTVARIPELELTEGPGADFICTVTALRFDTTRGTAGMVLSLVFMTNGGTKLLAVDMLREKLIAPEAASKMIAIADYHTLQDTGVKDFSTVRTLAMDGFALRNEIADVFASFRKGLIQQRCSAEKSIILKALKDIPKTEMPSPGSAASNSR